MKSIILFIGILVSVNADISHLLNKFRPSNSYLPPQRQPHSEYGVPSQGAQNYYSNIPESFIRINNNPGPNLQQSVFHQSSGQGFIPTYRQRPVEVQTIYVKEQSYQPQPPLIHQPAPIARPIPVFQPTLPQTYRPAPQIIQPVLQPPIIRQPAPVYQAAPFQQRPIEQYPIQQRPIEQYPIEQRPIEQYPIQQRPIEQYPIQQRPIEQYPIQQRPIEQYPIQQRPIEQYPIPQLPIHRPANEYLPPLASSSFALPSSEPAPSFHSGSTVSVLPSLSSTFIASKPSFGVSSIGSSAPSIDYLPPLQQPTFQQSSSGVSDNAFSFSSGGQGSQTIQEPVPAHNLDSNGYTYRRP